MELKFDYSESGRVINLRFEGLTGCEQVSSVKEALNVMQIKNPAIAFTQDVRAGLFDSMPEQAFEQMLGDVGRVARLWRNLEEQTDKPTRQQINPLALLLNAMETIITPPASRPERQRYLYRSDMLEDVLDSRIEALLRNRPEIVLNRVAVERRHIGDSGSATLLALAAELADFSRERGYPMGFRGLFGNLYLAHLLGIAALDPMELGLRWAGCLGWSGSRQLELNLNVAPELLPELHARLEELLLPECTLQKDSKAQGKYILIPEGGGGSNPTHRYLSISLCPHSLFSQLGRAQRQSEIHPQAEDIFSAELISSSYRADTALPALHNLEGFRELCQERRPRTFPELVRLMGVCLQGRQRLEELSHLGNSAYDCLIGTREDVYDLLVEHGIGADDAFILMEQVGRGGGLTAKGRALLDEQGIPDKVRSAIESTGYLYPRGQCADYLYRELSLLWYRQGI